MILKIERIRDSRKVRLRLSGEFRSHHLDPVKAEISRREPIALDLEETLRHGPPSSLSAGIRCGSQGDPCDPFTQENSLHYLHMVRRQ
jgi:hypothetical protein